MEEFLESLRYAFCICKIQLRVGLAIMPKQTLLSGQQLSLNQQSSRIKTANNGLGNSWRLGGWRLERAGFQEERTPRVRVANSALGFQLNVSNPTWSRWPTDSKMKSVSFATFPQGNTVSFYPHSGKQMHLVFSSLKNINWP